MAIIAFNKSRKAFNEFLSSNNSLNKSRYFRLMCLAGFETLCTVPLGLYAIARNTRPEIMEPWLGWADTHSNFSRVVLVPAILWRYSGAESDLELTRWFAVIGAFAFFGFFGFAEEARKNYRTAVQSVAKTVGVSTDSMGGSTMFSFSGYVPLLPPELDYPSYIHIPSRTKSAKGMTSSGGVGTLPVFMHRQTVRKCDDLDSISDMSTSDEKEKDFSPDLSYGGLSLSDVGGTLADYKEDSLSPTPTSGSSSASSLSPATSPTSLPQIAVTRPAPSIEVSSVRYHGGERPESIILPSPIYDDRDVGKKPHDMV